MTIIDPLLKTNRSCTIALISILVLAATTPGSAENVGARRSQRDSGGESSKQTISATVIVNIVDLETGRSIPLISECAEITMQGSGVRFPLTFDPQFGIAQIGGLLGGSYTLSVEASGYMTEEIGVEVPNSGIEVLRVELMRELLVDGFKGSVFDAVSGFTLEASTVEIPDLGTVNAICNVGTFQFSNVPSSDYIVTASKAGYASQTLRIRVDNEDPSDTEGQDFYGLDGSADDEETPTVNFALTSDLQLPGQVTGTVTRVFLYEDSPDVLVEGAEIAFDISACDAEVKTITDADGSYSVASLPPSVLQITLRINGRFQDSKEITLGDSETVTVDFEVFDGGTAMVCSPPRYSGTHPYGNAIEFVVLFALFYVVLAVVGARRPTNR